MIDKISLNTYYKIGGGIMSDLMSGIMMGLLLVSAVWVVIFFIIWSALGFVEALITTFAFYVAIGIFLFVGYMVSKYGKICYLIILPFLPLGIKFLKWWDKINERVI